ncbi:MAG: prephenate dehydrogenase/arogenate dehydrogenase family protein [Cellvibrionales bacterium]|jgi:prephenate dehydrogenase
MGAFPVQRITLVGLGLIAGSLALALKKAGWQGELVAWGPREPSLQKGVDLGVIDRFSLDLETALADTGLIVVGAPPMATGEILTEILGVLEKSGSLPVVTDLASIKGWVIARANTRYSRFVPGHPIAGSENSGVAAANADLFRGREAILTPVGDTDAQAVETVRAMWQLVGSRVTVMSVENHDAALAASSHSPHMLAYALTKALAKDPLDPMKHGGGALRDMTRIAASDPVMWRDVALTNRDALIVALEDVQKEIALLQNMIAKDDAGGLESYFAECREQRRRHDAILNPLLGVDGADDAEDTSECKDQ